MNLSGLHRKFVLNGRDTLDPTKVTGPTQLLSLGYIWESVPGIDTDGVSTANADQGIQKWIYIKAIETLAEGTVVGRNGGTSDYIGKVTANNCPAMDVIGIAQYEILIGEYGFILREGLTSILTTVLGGLNGVPLVTAAGAAGEAESWVTAAGPTTEQVDQNARIIGITVNSAGGGFFRIHCTG